MKLGNSVSGASMVVVCEVARLILIRMVRNYFLPEVLRMRNSFIDEEMVIDNVFYQIEAGEVENPGITESIYTDYFNKCSKYFDPVKKQLERLPNKPARVEKNLNEFRTKSSRVGAIRVLNAIDELERCVPGGNYLECQVAFRNMKREFEFLKNNLETYFELRYRFPKCS